MRSIGFQDYVQLIDSSTYKKIIEPNHSSSWTGVTEEPIYRLKSTE